MGIETGAHNRTRVRQVATLLGILAAGALGAWWMVANIIDGVAWIWKMTAC